MINYLIKRLLGDALNCREVSDFLTDYLEDALTPDVKRQFEEHVQHCKHCRALLRQFQTTVELTRETKPVEPPEELAEHTLTFLRERLGQA